MNDTDFKEGGINTIYENVVNRSKQLGMYELMVELATHFGPFESVEVSKEFEGKLLPDCGYRAKTISEPILDVRPVTLINSKKSLMIVDTPTRQLFADPKQITKRFVTYREVVNADFELLERIYPATGF